MMRAMDAFDHLSIHWDSNIPLAQQLSQQLLWLIASGAVRPGERLPNVRDLAARLNINLHTVRAAYRKLEADGLVLIRQGRGTKVLSFDSRRLAHIAATYRTHTVGVIIPSMDNPFYHALVAGVEEVAAADDTLLFVGNTHDVPSAAARYFAQMAVKQVDGIIVASHDTSALWSDPADKDLEQPRLPVVTVDWPGASGPCALLDLEDAGFQATRHLLEHGHRRTALVTVDADAPNVRLVEEGYYRALREAGQALDPEMVVRVPGWGIPAGQAGAQQLLALAQRPTAIFGIADTLALGVLAELKTAGLRVPEDVALAGFNDIPAAGLLDPALTTVSAPVRELGAEAMRMLQHLIAGQALARREVVLPVTLVVRASCGSHS
jgi:DNA-binding LacI/PurR family transcriptional regulator